MNPTYLVLGGLVLRAVIMIGFVAPTTSGLS